MRRPEKELILATRAFTTEDRGKSIAAAVSTFAVLAAITAVTALAPLAWPLRLLLGVVEGLVVVRAFCLFHDVQHGALLRGSAAWRAFFWLFGELILVPPSVWRETHNYHHAHTAQLVGSHIGSYALITPRMYAKLSPAGRFAYRAVRHPLNVALALLTVFFAGMCLRPFFRAPKKHFEAIVSPLLVAALGATAAWFHRFDAFVFGWAWPMAVAAAMGAYLFYAQHNFPDAHLSDREHWSYAGAALDSSSYMELSPLMHWFTANIGYHHVHHLNAAIPFYRLPEAMAQIEELQAPGKTSLKPSDVLACFKLKLWEPETNTLVGFTSASYSSLPDRQSS